MKNQIKDIKIDKEITLQNLGYIPRTPTYTDDEIIYYLVHKQRFGPRMYKAKKELEDNLENNKTYFDQKMSKLLPDHLEAISRKYWPDFRDMIGADCNNFNLSYYQILKLYYHKYFEPSSRIIILQSCSNQKPYLDNIHYRYCLQKYQRKGIADLMVSSMNLNPIDFTLLFPTRYYNWNHKWETPFTTEQAISFELNNLIDMISYFGYKYIIFFTPGGPDYFYNELFRRVNKVYEGTNKEFYFAIDDNTYKNILKNHGGGAGIAKLRFDNLEESRERLNEIIENIIKKDPASIRIKKVYKDGFYYNSKENEYNEFLINRKNHDQEEINHSLNLTENQMQTLKLVTPLNKDTHLIYKQSDIDGYKAFYEANNINNQRIKKERFKREINSNKENKKVLKDTLKIDLLNWLKI